ncbi:MAG: GIY-YIG nuclease family protein [Rhizobiaceae bacterium]|nr:GIY-YIG nuclease family protein [Rhizobiaceae bacterium]
MGVESRRLPHFPASSTFRARFRSKQHLLERALAFARTSGTATKTVAQLAEAVARAAPDRRREPVQPPRSAGYVYMMRFGSSYYKIGRTNRPDRRQFEIGLSLPDKVKPIHAIRTDDPSGIEAYWHRRFKEKRLNGEWFRLSRDDVTDFKRRKFM